MTESSAEKSQTAEQAKSEETKVPVAAVAKERAEKRAARAEAAELRGELEKVRTESPGLDAEAYAKLAEELAEEARRAVEAELQPWKADVAKYKMAMQMGLNEPQADKLMEIKSKNPGLTEQQALLLAKADAPDLFQTQASRPSWDRSKGGLPVTGDSLARSQPQSDDFMGLMREAEQKGDRMAAQRYAKEEALSRFRRVFQSRPIR